MTEVLTNYEQQPVGRPTFLTVLCILTFIGSGLGLISNVRGYFAANAQAAIVATAKESVKDNLGQSGSSSYDKLAAQMVDTLAVLSPENLKKSAIAGLVAAVLCLIGAFLMWGLKKTGFYAYVAGTLVGVIVPIVIFGFGNIFSLGITIVGGFFGVLFVVLYGLNLKYMK